MPIFKSVVRVLYGAAFIFAGVSHFTNRDFFASIVPQYLPWPALLVYISGVAEILLGGLLMVPMTSRQAAWGLIVLLIAVFPANIHMAMNPQLFPDISLTALLVRLPLQLVFIAIAYWFTRRSKLEVKSEKLGIRSPA